MADRFHGVAKGEIGVLWCRFRDNEDGYGGVCDLFLRKMTEGCALVLRRDHKRSKNGAIWAGLLLTLLGLPLTGCVHRYRIAPMTAAGVASTSSQPVHTTIWGLSEQVVRPGDCHGSGKPEDCHETIKLGDCHGNGMAEVILSRTFGQRFISVLSLGFYDPATMEWRCSKDSYSQSPLF